MIPDKDIAELTVDREIDQDSGEIRVNYFWKGLPIPKVAVSGKHAERMSGLAMIQKDLRNALKWMDKAHALFPSEARGKDKTYLLVTEREVADDIKAFFIAALVFYGKAFTEASGRKAQMARDWLDAKYRPVHDHFMALRHNLAAHSGDQRDERAQSYLFLVSEGRGPIELRVITNRMQPDLVCSDKSNTEFRVLLKHAIDAVALRYNKMAKRLIEQAIRKGPEFWSDAARAGDSIDVDALIRAKNEDVPQAGETSTVMSAVVARVRQPPGRNALCWCGSGRKYKRCHLGQEK